MVAREKAYQLYWYFYQQVADSSSPNETAKELAVFSVGEILRLHKKVALDTLHYYLEVKTEIEKI